MTVGELKELLKDVLDDRLIVQSRDAEGNSFCKTADVDIDADYDPEECEVKHPDDAEDHHVKVVCFWP